MIVSQRTIEAIQSGRIRQRTLEIPVKYGREFGNRLRCKLHVGGVYTLYSKPSIDDLRVRALQMPSRATAVLWFIDQCQQPSKQVQITVVGVERLENSWLIRFRKGEHPELFDERRLLNAKFGSGDYTTIPSRSARGAGEEVPANTLNQYAAENASVHRMTLDRLHMRALEAVQEIMPHVSGRQAKRLRAASNQIRASAD